MYLPKIIIGTDIIDQNGSLDNHQAINAVRKSVRLASKQQIEVSLVYALLERGDDIRIMFGNRHVLKPYFYAWTIVDFEFCLTILFVTIGCFGQHLRHQASGSYILIDPAIVKYAVYQLIIRVTLNHQRVKLRCSLWQPRAGLTISQQDNFHQVNKYALSGLG